MRFAIDGLRNPIAGPGHVANGADASENARARIAFEIRRGRTRHNTIVIRSPHNRREVIRGRLLNSAGKPISGGKLVTASQQTGGRWTAKTGVVTTRTGHFVYILPKGPSRRVKFVYFAFSDSTSYSESNPVTQHVRTPVSLRVAPRAARNGRTVRFAGTIARNGLPRTGVLVTLEARYPGSRWKQFKVVRTTRVGSFTATYRFTSTSTRTRYEFRAHVAKQGLYPFDGGLSRTTAVTVQP